jgi:hypothetical protein
MSPLPMPLTQTTEHVESPSEPSSTPWPLRDTMNHVFLSMVTAPNPPLVPGDSFTLLLIDGTSTPEEGPHAEWEETTDDRE